MVDPPDNTRLNMWGLSNTTEPNILNPPDTVNHVRGKLGWSMKTSHPNASSRHQIMIKQLLSKCTILNPDTSDITMLSESIFQWGLRIT